jgi:hypothetical protein
VKIILPPKEGVVGESALREAKTGELSQVIELVQRSLRNQFPALEGYAIAIYADRIVMRVQGRDWAYSYALNDNNEVSFGSPVAVVMDHVPVRMVESIFIEAKANAEAEAKPSRYLVRVIKSGVSENRVNYPAAVLREAVSLFNGVRVFAKSDAEHIKGGGKDFKQLVGRLVEAKWVATQGGGEIHATLEVLDASDVADKLREAVARDMTDLFGLSIDAQGTSKQTGRFKEATKLIKVDSVDLIIEPGAGGQIIRFTEAVKTQEPDMLRQQMIDQIRGRNPALATQLESATDEAVLTAFREACAAAPAATVVQSVTPEQLQETVRMVEAKANMRTTIAASKLPQAAKDKLVAQFATTERFVEADVTAAIKAEGEYLSRFVEAGKITGLGEVSAVEGGDRADKVTKMLDDWFDPSKKATSFREAYIEITGDRMVTGLLQNCDAQRLREAVGETNFREAISSGTFANVLGNSITRAMIREYGALEAYNDWRWIVDVVPVKDFRTNERTRVGGYGNLPAVAQNGPYVALSTPADEKATYAATKRGGLETISLEAIANDDVGLFRRIPLALATAAGRTLYEFVFDFLATNALVYDGLALFVGGHNNLGTAALDATSFAAARLRMKKQAELSSAKRLGITLRHVVIPSDLEETAFNLFVKNTNNDETFVQSRKPTVHVIDYWTDVNNWFATADKSQVPLIEMGFYGNEEPELFVQDNPTQGSLFSNDQIVYKIRHIYGGTVRDTRGFDGSIVA